MKEADQRQFCFKVTCAVIISTDKFLGHINKIHSVRFCLMRTI